MVLTKSLLDDLPIQFDDLFFDSKNTAFNYEYFDKADEMNSYNDKETAGTNLNRDDIQHETSSMFGTNVNTNNSEDIGNQNKVNLHINEEADDHTLETTEVSRIDSDLNEADEYNREERGSRSFKFK